MRPLVAAAPLIVAMACLAAAVAYLATDRVADPATVAQLGRVAAARRDAVGFGVLTLVAGALAALLFGWLDGFWGPTRAVFAGLGICVAIALSAAAAVRRPRLGLGGVRELTALSLVCGVAYGIGIPVLI